MFDDAATVQVSNCGILICMFVFFSFLKMGTKPVFFFFLEL